MSLVIFDFQLGILILLSLSKKESAGWHRKTGRSVEL